MGKEIVKTAMIINAELRASGINVLGGVAVSEIPKKVVFVRSICIA